MARYFVHLSLDERRVIAQMNESKVSQAEIARRLGRDRSTICRPLGCRRASSRARLRLTEAWLWMRMTIRRW
jgi:IS30 family transposase